MTERPPSLTSSSTGYAVWLAEAIAQQPVGQLPWGHSPVLPVRLPTPGLRLASAQRALEHDWSRNVLQVHFEQELGRLPDATPGEEC